MWVGHPCYKQHTVYMTIWRCLILYQIMDPSRSELPTLTGRGSCWSQAKSFPPFASWKGFRWRCHALNPRPTSHKVWALTLKYSPSCKRIVLPSTEVWLVGLGWTWWHNLGRRNCILAELWKTYAWDSSPAARLALVKLLLLRLILGRES